MSNGIEKITDRIIGEAEDEAKKNIETAKSEAAEIAGRYKKTADEIVERYLKEGEREAVAVAQRSESGTDFKNRSAALTAKGCLIDEAFDKALEKLKALDGEKYYGFLEKQLNDVIASLVAERETRKKSGDEYDDCDDYVLRLNKRDLSEYGDKLCKSVKAIKLTPDDVPVNIAGGFILKNGNMEANCSLEIIMAQQRPLIEKDVYKTLFV